MELPDGYVDSRSQLRLSVLIRRELHNSRRFIGLRLQKEEYRVILVDPEAGIHVEIKVCDKHSGDEGLGLILILP